MGKHLAILALNKSVLCAGDEKTTVDVVNSDTSQATSAAASQTDEDVTIKQQSLNFSLVSWMINHFLAHAIDIKRSNLVDRLVTKDVISSDEREQIKKRKKTYAKVGNLVTILREKSAAKFDSFLAALSETGQRSVADVVRRALHTVGQLGQNPLQHLGKRLFFTNSTQKRRNRVETYARRLDPTRS